MAGASMNDIKARIKSVEGTMQITKAMELVATSKLRRAKERVERSRPYRDTLEEAIKSIASCSDVTDSVWKHPESADKILYIVMAGDRGLAGGYNANVFRLTESLFKKDESKEHLILPIGKKALEYYRYRGHSIYSSDYEYISDMGVGDAVKIGEEVCFDYVGGCFDKVVLVYTKFISMMREEAVYSEMLPLCNIETEDGVKRDPIFEGDKEELLARTVPSYIGGVIYSALCEAAASEQGARRNSMSSANKNAGEIIDTLMLKYNRARQAVITQEITEIVSGAEALS